MTKSVLKGGAFPNLVNAFVNAFDADPWRFPDVATVIVVDKTSEAHVYKLVSGGDVLEFSFPDAATGEPLGTVDAKEGFGKRVVYTADGQKRQLSGRWREAADTTAAKFDPHAEILSVIEPKDREFLKEVTRIKKEIDLAFK
jgi:hypothetical protein